jgi:peptide/nickel transport system substrate-binding protein
VPWPLSRLDPHDLFDGATALFGSAVFDSLYGLDESGVVYPTLADGMPRESGNGVELTLRPGLTSARGKSLDARDVLYSLERARGAGAQALLSGLGQITRVPNESLKIRIERGTPDAVSRALSSPVTALVPRGFSAREPDGTGAFRASLGPRGLRLDRNLAAARGAAFLDRIDIERASDLADALRAFESGESDVGWMGTGLHQARSHAERFDAGSVGWVVLLSGKESSAWSSAGVTQRLLDGIPKERLTHLGLRLPDATASGAKWGGPSGDILVDESAAHLVEIARTAAGILSTPGHELSARLVSRATLDERRKSGNFSLAVEFVRNAYAADPVLALFAAARPDLAAHPPKTSNLSAREITRTLPLGVMGELAIFGAHTPELRGVARWDLGAMYREKKAV